MALTRTSKGWTVDIQPAGRGGKRYRKTFRTQAEAKAWEAWLKTNINSNASWSPEKRDIRRLSELAKIWYDNHGKELTAGDDTYNRIRAAITAMSDPIVNNFSTTTFTEYRTKRVKEGVSLNTINREHAYLRAMFNELKRLGQWKKDNPLKEVRLFKIKENELSFLSKVQILKLLKELKLGNNYHVYLVSKICLSTGARWSEAEKLTIKQVRHGVIQFARTKSGKTRAVPISKDLEDEIIAHNQNHKNMGAIFEPCYGAFREAIDRAEIELPAGQLTHVLRHTFASHFMINGGNILSLQRILGHKDLKTTMRYAHLAPEHLESAKTLNPLAILAPLRSSTKDTRGIEVAFGILAEQNAQNITLSVDEINNQAQAGWAGETE